MPGYPPWLDLLDAAPVEDPSSLEAMRKAYEASKKPGAPLFPQSGQAGQGVPEGATGGAALGRQVNQPLPVHQDEDLKTVPVVPEDKQGSVDSAGKIMSGQMANDLIYAKPPLAQQPGVPVPAQTHEYRIGGPGTLQKIFKTDPERTAEAIRQGAEATEQEGKQTENFYTQERQRQGDAAAVREAHRQEYFDEIAKRQQELDGNVKKYTQDLADTGKFWRNPGNILAAFGAAVMDMGGHGQDTGWKMIQSAIRNDLYQRHKLADMHLGELRSNLSGYRQLAQDRQSGDLIAEAEANRIAAMQLKEIAGRFQGKKAKAAAETYIAELTQKSDAMWAEWYQKIMTMPHVGNKVIEDLIKRAGADEINGATRGGPVGSELPGAQPEVPPNPYGEAPKPQLTPLQQKALGAFSQGVQPFKSRINQMFGTADPEVNTATADAVGRALKINPKQPPGLVDQRMAGASGLAKQLNAALVKEAMGSKGVWDHAAEVKFDALRAQDDKDLFELGKNQEVARYGANTKIASHIRQQMTAYEAAARAFGKSPQELWGSMRELTGDALANKIRQITTDDNIFGKPNTEEGKQAKRLLDASEALHQLVSLGVNGYLQSSGGKALTESEVEQYSSLVGKAQNWDYVRRGVNLLDKSLSTSLDSYLSGASPRVMIRYKVQNGIQPTQSDYAALGK